MKVIIAGSRDIKDLSLIYKAIRDSGFDITEVVSGKQRSYNERLEPVGGVDFLGELWACANNIPVRGFDADWENLGRAAGPIRNTAMAKYADALICIHHGSKGSEGMLRIARAMGLNVFEVKVEKSVDG